MGARAQVFMKDTGVYLYTHSGAGILNQVVREALDSDRGKSRKNDPEYLTRIILEDMIMAEQSLGSETGFGVSSEPMDGDFTITVKDGEIRV